MGWSLALSEFELPPAPQRLDELPAPLPGEVEACVAQAPAGRFRLISSRAPLQLAFEATLFDLLAEARFPVPPPRRARAGALIAMLPGNLAASCYPQPPGEPVAAASQPQLLDLGRLLARLHSLGETHPARVPGHAPAGLEPLPQLPSGAIHGGLLRERALFIGKRCSALLPSGLACFGPLALDLAIAAVSLMDAQPLATLRALVSGYQALRRLEAEEILALPLLLRHAAAREGARGAALGVVDPMGALRTVEALDAAEVRAVAGK